MKVLTALLFNAAILPFSVAAIADTSDMGVVMIESLDKKMELHNVLMSGAQCEAMIKKIDAEGEYVGTIKFPDGDVHGLIKGWYCIKPNGTLNKTKNMPALPK